MCWLTSWAGTPRKKRSLDSSTRSKPPLHDLFHLGAGPLTASRPDPWARSPRDPENHRALALALALPLGSRPSLPCSMRAGFWGFMPQVRSEWCSSSLQGGDLGRDLLSREMIVRSRLQRPRASGRATLYGAYLVTLLCDSFSACACVRVWTCVRMASGLVERGEGETNAPTDHR